jgi:hypothetical protein
MDWQQAASLAVVGVTLGLFLRFHLLRRRQLPFETSGHCGCSGNSSIRPGQSIILTGRRGERPRMLVKGG